METKITVLPDQDGEEFTIREGKALELKPPQKILIAGDITAVRKFLQKRKVAAMPGSIYEYNLQPVENDLSIVIVDKEKQTIQLQVSPNEFYGTEVTGELKNSEELKPFFINEPHLFDRQELTKLLRFNKRFFADGDLHQSLLEKLAKLRVDSQVNSTAGNDTRGNKNAAFDKVVNTDLPNGFFLVIPVFKNGKAHKFYVELSLDTSEGNTRFWLESVELVEMKERGITEIFDEELKACEGLVIINK